MQDQAGSSNRSRSVDVNDNSYETRNTSSVITNNTDVGNSRLKQYEIEVKGEILRKIIRIEGVFFETCRHCGARNTESTNCQCVSDYPHSGTIYDQAEGHYYKCNRCGFVTRDVVQLTAHISNHEDDPLDNSVPRQESSQQEYVFRMREHVTNNH